MLTIRLEPGITFLFFKNVQKNMIGYEQAKEEVIEFLNKNANERGYKVLLNEPGIEILYGWIFSYDQEGVFHPQLKKVEEKVKHYIQNEMDDDEALKLLTEEENRVLENGIGLVGNLPVFIDKQTGEIENYQFPVEAIIQEIKEKKTGIRYSWELHFIKKTDIELAEVRALYRLLDLNERIEIPTLFKKIKRGETLLATDSYRKLLSYKTCLNSLNFRFKIIELKN